MEKKSRFLGLGQEVDKPEEKKNTELIYLERKSDDEVKFIDTEPDFKNIPEKIGISAVRIRKEPVKMELSFAEVTSLAKEKGSCDVNFEGRWVVSDSQKFLNAYGVKYLVPGTNLSEEMAEAWIANRLNPRIRDAVSDYSREELRYNSTSPLSWWESEFKDWLKEMGVSVKINNISWEKSRQKNFQVEKVRQKALEKMEEEQRRHYLIEVDRQKKEAEYKRKKEKIKNDQALSQREKEARLQMLEEEYKKKLIEAHEKAEEVRLKAQKTELKHEIKMAKLKNKLERVKEKEKQIKQTELEKRKNLSQLEKAKDALEEITEHPEELLAKMEIGDNSEKYQVNERLTSPEFDLSPEVLKKLGYSSSQQDFLQNIKNKIAEDNQPVQLKKKGLISRDICHKRVNVLPINKSLQFELLSQKAGFVTLINIGTSGTIWLHVPNAYIAPEKAEIERDKSYSIPGPTLLPKERLAGVGLDYVEAGPPGWEHLVIIISEKPLITKAHLTSTSEGLPFAQLSLSQLEEIKEKLSSAYGSWSAGHLSFKVE